MLKFMIKQLIDGIYGIYHSNYTYRQEIKKLNSRKHLWKKVKLSGEQKKEIRSLYGRKVSNKWHRLYQAYNGSFNKEYFPEILFSTKLEPILCPRSISKVLKDKSLVELLYSSVAGLRFPKTIVVNCSGIYYDKDRNIISREMAATKVREWCSQGRFIIKPIDSYEGRGFASCDPLFYNSESKILKLFDKYKMNFILQERVENCKEISELHCGSLNTFRIMTYILDETLYHSPAVLRIGRGNSITDDEIYIGISEVGVLNKQGVTFEGDRFFVHPDSHIRFEGYVIPFFSKLLDYTRDCHVRTPHIRFLSWDITLDKQYNPVLIEVNTQGHSSWFPQSVSGEALFGSNTKRMLEMIGMY